MSHRALNRLVVRLLHDADFAARLAVDPDDALAGTGLSADERGCVAAVPSSAWRTDPDRPRRVLSALRDEYAASARLAGAHADRFFASTHQYPLYPGTGSRAERGVGNIVNAPLSPGSGGPEFRHAMSELVLPRLSEFAPDFILISAGFDAHEDDPLAGLRLHEADYAWITKEILRIASYSCQGRVVSTLEGGYDLTALAESAAAHVRALMAG